MTGIQLAVHKIISGVQFLPASDQQGLFQAMRALERVFSPGEKLTEDQHTGCKEIEEGIMLLLKHAATGLLSRDGLSRKLALIKQAAIDLHPEFLARFRQSHEG